MTIIVDRRKEPLRHKFGKDQERFLHRIRKALRKAIDDKVTKDGIRDLGKGGIKVPIPKEDTQEPVIHHQQGGDFKKVFPGNLYEVGDVVPVPKGGGGGKGRGKDASPDGEDGQDDFVYLPEEEFLKIFFEGRTLPNLVKMREMGSSLFDRQRAGHSNKGPSHRMDRDITDKKRKADAIVLNTVGEKNLTDNLLEQYSIYRLYNSDLPALELNGKNKTEKLEAVEAVLGTLQSKFNMSAEGANGSPTLSALFRCIEIVKQSIGDSVSDPQHIERLGVLEARIPEQLKVARTSKNFQNKHLTYDVDEDVPKPTAKAVMFCKMDVSGSMGEHEKNTAKAFFAILYRFLKSNYKDVELVFISHTTEAMEVDEQEFFYGQRTGGTVVSTCLEEELKIIKERYPVSEWNIFSAQATDGDNYNEDNRRVAELMDEVMAVQQASYFIEVRNPHYGKSDLHKIYLAIAKKHPHLFTATVNSPGEAIDAFKAFFPIGGLTARPEPAAR